MTKLKNSREIEEGCILESGTAVNNKTGDWKIFKPVVDFNKCIHCMRCVIFCPDLCIRVKDKKRLETNFEMCKGCGICETECPVKAIKMVKE